MSRLCCRAFQRTSVPQRGAGHYRLLGRGGGRSYYSPPPPSDNVPTVDEKTAVHERQRVAGYLTGASRSAGEKGQRSRSEIRLAQAEANLTAGLKPGFHRAAPAAQHQGIP